jgi:hypothetical protein
MKSKITVDQISESQPIYAINKSNGDFLLTLKSEDGRNELVPIPKTWIPIQLTNFAEPKLFKRSSDFRRTVAAGSIEIISQEEAQEILRDESAQAELERIRRTAFSDVNYESESSDGITPVQAAADMNNNNVNTNVKDVILRDDISDDEKKSMLINEHKTGSPLTKDDLDFIMVTADENSKIYNCAKQAKENNKNQLFNGK